MPQARGRLIGRVIGGTVKRPARVVGTAGVHGLILALSAGLFACAGPTLLPAGPATTGPATSATSSRPTSGRSSDPLVERMRKGGLLIYIRHTEREDKAESVIDPPDCTVQANLTKFGAEQAVRLGQSYRALGVPIGAVYASPSCRTLDTATLAFGRGAIADPLLAGSSFAGGPGPAEWRERLYVIQGEARPGLNNVVVGHSEVLADGLGLEPPGTAESVLVKLGGTEVGRLPFDRLVELAG